MTLTDADRAAIASRIAELEAERAKLVALWRAAWKAQIAEDDDDISPKDFIAYMDVTRDALDALGPVVEFGLTAADLDFLRAAVFAMESVS